jgi:hypothetical protein
MLNLFNTTLAEFWSGDNGSTYLWGMILGTFLFGVLMIVAFTFAPPRARRLIVGGFTFFSGLIYVLYFFWPTVPKGTAYVPGHTADNFALWLKDGIGIAGTLANILTAFLLGLGMYSLLRIHVRRLFKGQRDWFFSLVLMISMISIIIFGYWNWHDMKGPQAGLFQFQANWKPENYAFDFLFDGLLQQMDAAMFSIIAFYILSAAYRAFRVRSVEATILLATALLVMLSVMGAVEFLWNNGVDSMTGHDPNSLLNNLKLTEIAKWLRDTFQTSGLRALDFGVGIGALAMGLRLWLSLERGGVSS